MHELLLERDRPRREHDLLSAADRRNEIRERFSDAGTRFDDRVHAFHDAALDELRHLQLPRARLEAGQLLRERAVALPKTCSSVAVTALDAADRSGDSYSVSSSRPLCASTTTGATRRGGK